MQSILSAVLAPERLAHEATSTFGFCCAGAGASHVITESSAFPPVGSLAVGGSSAAFVVVHATRPTRNIRLNSAMVRSCTPCRLQDGAEKNCVGAVAESGAALDLAEALGDDADAAPAHALLIELAV